MGGSLTWSIGGFLFPGWVILIDCWGWMWESADGFRSCEPIHVMPSPTNFDERLRAMESWTAKHDGECSIRNAEITEWRREISSDMTSLKIEKAKVAGYLLGIAAAGSVVGTGVMQAVMKLIGE